VLPLRGRCLKRGHKAEPVVIGETEEGREQQLSAGGVRSGCYFYFFKQLLYVGQCPCVCVCVCVRCCVNGSAGKWKDSHALFVTYCQVTSSTTPIHIPPPPNHRAVTAISYIFYAYQSPVLSMPITPHPSPDACQSVTVFFSSSFPLIFSNALLASVNPTAGHCLSL